MHRNDWLQDLQMLAWRASGLGVVPDLATLGLWELWGMYCHLRRVLDV